MSDGIEAERFAIVPQWLMESGVSDRAVVLFAWLHRYADSGGASHPGRKRLAAHLKCSESSVDRAVNELATAGALRVEARYTESGDRTSNRYILFHQLSSPVTRGPFTGEGTVASPVKGRVASPVTNEGEPVLNESQVKERARKRATSVPDPFVVTEAMRAWAAADVPSVDVDKETAQFLDYHGSRGSVFKDWTMAWRTWMRNAVKFSGNGRAQLAFPNEPTAPKAWDAIARARAKGG